MKHSELSQAVLIAVVLSVIFVACYSVFGHTLLLRPFWMDEVHSWLLISDPDPIHALQSLKNGADFNPPVYYAVARVFSWVVPLSEHNLRVLSALLILSMAIGLALVFDRHMKMAASIGCSLLVCSQQLVILQSTEVRFYALWLALLTWFCFGLTTGKRSLIAVQLTVLSLLAALTAGTHYFGIISIGIVCFAFAAARKFQKDALVRAGVPFMAAVLTVACCLPLLSGQKAALTAATWVVPTDLERATAYVIQFFPGMILLVAVAIWLIGFLWKGAQAEPLLPTDVQSDQILTGDQKESTSAVEPSQSCDDFEKHDDNQVPLDSMFVFGSLLLMPLVLIAFSLFVQPALVNRYAVVGCLWMVPVLTFFLHTGDTRKSFLVLFAGCVMFAVAVRNGSATWDYNLNRSQDLVQQLEDIPSERVVLFEDRIDYWMAQHQGPKASWYQLDFQSAAGSQISNLKLVQRDVGRAIQSLYPGRFPMKSISDFEGQDVYVVPYRGEDVLDEVAASGRSLTNFSDRIIKAAVK